MHNFASDVGGFIWFAIVVIGVISSVVKSAKRKNAAQGGDAAQTPPPASVVRVAGVPTGLHAQFAATATPVATPNAAPSPVRRPPVRPPAPAPMPVRAAAPPPLQALESYATVPDYVAPPTSYVPAALDTAPPPHAFVVQNRPLRAARLLGSKHAILRSIVASEILGKPRALRDEY